ncbi:Zn-ribbon domain-containing OB-fold protein [Pseudomonas sp. MYb118]|uniref:Zn-ribbon domain-containing OB-fold protein n=1 Tax=Pseudomonas sp. MYb118 TaxID=1848720 RepID=UPI0034CFF72D
MATFSSVTRDNLSATWWDANQQQRLLIQRNPVSGAWQWYPRAHCVDDLDVAPEWVQVSGRGTVFSYTVIHRGHTRLDAPYVCAVIELEEGPLMLSQLRDVAVEDISIGMPVMVAFAALDSSTSLPVFQARSHS